jgi:two-component system, chemotaxis family, protein-glutamate methylesterase/glutaminase
LPRWRNNAVIKLLIVDDSALMRRQLMTVFQEAGGFEMRQARNGLEAVTENREFQPDVVTLDINMPELDGLTALSLIMAERPVAVVMVSSLTAQGALATFEALNLGAVDYVAKPGGTISLSMDAVKAELLSKVRGAARARVQGKAANGPSLAQRLQNERKKTAAAASTAAAQQRVVSDGLLVIGASTGGPRTLELILAALPANFPWPVLVAQHMPAAFTKSFADRLNQCCPLTVTEAGHPMPVEPGNIYIGKGGADMLLTMRAGKLTVVPTPENPAHLWHPSVELLGRSALEKAKAAQITGVMLTGMGNDGSDSFAEIKKRGGRTIAESESSCAVFGMPAELINKGGASIVLAADRIAGQLNLWAGR